MDESLTEDRIDRTECVPPHSTSPRKWGLLWIPALFVGLAPLSFQVLAVTPVGYYFPSDLIRFLHSLSVLFAILTILSIPVVIWTFLRALLFHDTHNVLSRCITSITLVVSMMLGAIGSTEVHFRALEGLSVTGMEVVHAVTEYEMKYGRLPESIGDLVPSILAEIPKTGFPAYPDFELVRFPDNGFKPGGNPWMLTVPYTGLAVFAQFNYLPKKNYDEINTTGFVVGDWLYVDDELRWPDGGMRRLPGKENTSPTPSPEPGATPPSPLPPLPEVPGPPGTGQD